MIAPKGSTIVVALACCAFLAASAHANDKQTRPALDAIYEVGIEAKLYGEGIQLNVRFDPGSMAEVEALRVYSLPSETLLLTHYDPDRHLWPKAGLSVSRGAMAAFQHQVVVPRDFAMERDDRISVRLVHEGEEYVVSQGKVDLRDFQVTSRFSLNTLLGRDGAVTKTGGCGPGEWEHCSGGPRCTFGCICCSSPYFCANLITCNMECGNTTNC